MELSQDNVNQFLQRARKLLLEQPDLHSVSIGSSGASALSIFVSFTPPIPRSTSERSGKYAQSADFPESFKDLPIVEENRLAGARSTAAVAAGRCSLQKVLQPGLDIAAVPASGELHPRRGTLGCIVYDRITGEPMILSNWHVMSGETSLVLQPSSQLLPPSVASLCGRVMRSCVDLDCAVASAIGRKTNPRMLGLGVTPRQAKMPELGDPVVKFGAGNNRSYGIVKRIGIVRMNFGGAFADVLIPCCYIARDTAVDQVETGDQVRELVRPGDSGCVWMLRKKGPANVSRPQLRESMTQDPRKEMDPPQPEDEYLRATETAVALHFGADDAVEELALAVSMPMVLDQLNVTLAYPPAEKS